MPVWRFKRESADKETIEEEGKDYVVEYAGVINFGLSFPIFSKINIGESEGIDKDTSCFTNYDSNIYFES